MKQIATMMAIIAMYCSCKKDVQQIGFNTRIAGQWQLIKTCGGVAGDCWYPERTITQINFTQTGGYTKKENDSIIDDGQYKLIDSSKAQYFTVEITALCTILSVDADKFVINKKHLQYSTPIRFDNEYLEIPSGDIVETYRKKW